MNQPKHSHRGFFSVFLLAMLLTTQTLSFLVVCSMELLPLPILGLLLGLLGLGALLLGRGLLASQSRLAGAKRVLSAFLSLFVIVGCAAGTYTAFLLDSSLDKMFTSEEAVLTAAPAAPYEEPFVMYLGGSDTRSAALTKSRNDVNILAAVNPNTQQVLLVNTPRDYYVSNPAGGGAKDKLAHCGLYGLDNAKQTLSDLYGVPIAYGAVINFKGFETLIDAMGGITVHSDKAFTTTVGGYAIQEGDNQLNGAQALAFARERKGLADGDHSRGRNQIQVIGAMVRQMISGEFLRNWREVLTGLEGMFTTDMPLSVLTRMIAAQSNQLDQWQLLSVSVSGTDGTARNWSSGSSAYVIYPDDSVAITGEMLQRLLNGEVLTKE